MKPDPLSEPIFVGRAIEIDKLNACLDSVIEGKGRTVFVSGEAGTGKTRLVKEFLKTVHGNKLTLMMGWCLSNTPIPYFPFVEAFREYITRDSNKIEFTLPKKTRHELEIVYWALVEPVKEIFQSDGSSIKVWKDLTYDNVAKALQSASNLHPLLLFIDDLQWVDSASLTLLHYLSRALASTRVLIITTFRSEEICSDQEGQNHRLVETMRLMRRDDLFKEINLSNLSQTNVVEVAEDMVGGNLDPDFSMKLAVESQGNPLFVVESIRMLIENKQLVQENGCFHLAGSELGIPTKVKDIILRRLDSLTPDQRKMLELASVIGEKFDPKLLSCAISVGILDVLKALNDVSASSSLVFSQDYFYSFDHAKSREVLYGELPLALRREYHTKIAEELERMSENGKNVTINELAYHFAQAGKKEQALQYALIAGEHFLAKFSNEEAANYFIYVLQIVKDSAEYPKERNKALEGLGDALLAKGSYDQSEKTFEKLAESENGIIRLRALRKAITASQWRGDLNHALELADKAEKYADLDRLEYARLLMWKGRVIGFSGDADSAIRYLEEALRVFEKEYSLSDVAQALKEAAAYYITKGNVKRALAATRRASALYKDLEDLREQNETYLFEGIIFFSCGFNQEALDDYNKSMKISEKLIAFNEFTMTSLYSSLLLETKGNLEEALSISLGALKYSEKTDSIFLKFNNYQMLTRQYAKIRDMRRAQEFQEKFMKIFPIISEKGTKLAHASAVYANAVFLAIKEQWKQANSLFEESLQLLKTAVFSTLFEPIVKADYAICLAKQGQLVESQRLKKESIKLREVLKSRLETGEIQAYLMAKRETSLGEQLEIRLDIINVSKKPAQLLRIEPVLFSAFDIKSLPSYCIKKGDSIDLTEKKIAPFEVETIKFILQPREVGIFNLTPSLSYVKYNAKETLTYAIEPIKIIINPKNLSEQSVQTTASNMLFEFTFKTNAAKKAFNFLLMAFIRDYMQRRLPLDWSGWRTLMEIKKDAQVSKYSIYGNGKSRGRAITELQNRGLVEARIFPKERGRGGKITKVRVFYERETVKRRIDQEISVA